MKEDSLVYIVLVNYKGKIHTLECIESLKKITYKNYKIIVVDNCSNDGCLEEIENKYTDIITIQSGDNLGFAGGNNIAIRYAMNNGADFILLLNNDTTVEKNFLEELLKPFKYNENIGLTIGKIKYYFDKNLLWYAGGKINYLKVNSQVYGLNEIDDGRYDEEKKVTFSTGCCMLISKEIIEKVGYLNEDYFLYYEDTDYSCKINKLGYDMLYVPTAVIYHKESVATNKFSYNYQYYFARNRLMFIKNNMKIINKIFGYPTVILWLMKKNIIGEFTIKPCLKGIVDFLKKKKGKF